MPARQPLQQRSGVVKSDPDGGVALEGLDHRQIRGPVRLLDDPAKVADRLMVVERQRKSDATGQSRLPAGPSSLTPIGAVATVGKRLVC